MNNVNAGTAWAIASGKVIMPWSVRSTRREAIAAIEKNFDRQWPYLKRRGHSAIKIRMEPEPEAHQ